MDIYVISITAANSDDIALTLEISSDLQSSKQRFVISSEAYVNMGISKGTCSIETYDVIELESKIHSAYKRGLYLLGFTSYSKKALVSKLVSKGFERSISFDAVDRIAQKGFINDTSSALREAERCADKLWGVSRIRSHLLQKGFEQDSVSSALFSLEDSGTDFDENCKILIKKRFGELPADRAEMQKLICSTMRYGYSFSQIKKACEAISSED